MNFAVIQCGKYQVKTSDLEICLNPDDIRWMQEFLDRWVDFFPSENTWIHRSYGVPSVIVRFDCVIRGESRGIYELEERPAGGGLSKKINGVFANKLHRLQSDWLACGIDPGYVISHRREVLDDHLWLPPATDEHLIWPRVDHHESDYYHLQDRSLSVIATKGLKSYGIEMGLWKLVIDGENLPWHEPFVLKPLRGSKCSQVFVWWPDKKTAPEGAHTKSKITDALKIAGKMYLQEYIPAMSHPGLPGYGVFLRFFWGLNTLTGQYVPLGGMWMGRPGKYGHARLHGASDALSGPVCFKTS